MLPVTAECVNAAVPAMAANPEDIELGDVEEMDEEGEADGDEAAANMQLEEKAVPVCCPELGDPTRPLCSCWGGACNCERWSLHACAMHLSISLCCLC